MGDSLSLKNLCVGVGSGAALRLRYGGNQEESTKESQDKRSYAVQGQVYVWLDGALNDTHRQEW